MNKRDIKDGALDRPSKYQIILSKYLPEDEDDEYNDTGWECDVFASDWYIGGGTAPNQAGAYSLANDIIYDHENPSLF